MHLYARVFALVVCELREYYSSKLPVDTDGFAQLLDTVRNVFQREAYAGTAALLAFTRALTRAPPRGVYRPLCTGAG